MTNIFLYSQWTQLPLTTRMKIATDFGISKTMPTHVFNNQILQDGYDLRTVEANLNIDAIQKYVGSEETDMAVLWNLLVMKAEGKEPAELQPSIVIEEEIIVIEQPILMVASDDMVEITKEVIEEMKSEEAPKKRGRKAKTK